jgi:hypothetical protein
MSSLSSKDALKVLAAFVLPEGVLDYFEVVDVKENTVLIEQGGADKEGLYGKELEIYLDELDNRPPDMSTARGNGFTDECKILDFPLRNHKTILHIRRRRWLMPDGSSQIVNLEDKIQLAHPGTRYAKDFALFLKMAFGQ